MMTTNELNDTEKQTLLTAVVDRARADLNKSNCDHCYHTKRGPIMMVIPDGHVVEECCKCHQTRTVHVDHASTQPTRR